ncbi:hypothetical protein EBU24_01785, partial [bacterium]|nr:hypothetical protein [bacterium]
MKNNKIIALFFFCTFFISTNIKSAENLSLGDIKKSYPGIAQLLHGDVITLAKDMPTSYGEHIIAAGRFLSIMGATGYVNQTVFNESRMLYPNDNKHKHAFLAAAAAATAGYLTTKVIVPLTPEPLVNRIKDENQKIVSYFNSVDAHFAALTSLCSKIAKDKDGFFVDAYRNDVIDDLNTDANFFIYQNSRTRLGDELQVKRAYAALNHCQKFCDNELYEMQKRFKANSYKQEAHDTQGLMNDLIKDIQKIEA